MTVPTTKYHCTKPGCYEWFWSESLVKKHLTHKHKCPNDSQPSFIRKSRFDPKGSGGGAAGSAAGSSSKES